MNPYHQRDTFPGLFLPIWWDTRLLLVRPPSYPEEGDEQQLLQVSQSTALASTWKSANIDTDGPTPAVCRLQDEPSTGRLFAISEGDTEALPRPHQQPPRIPDDIATGTFMLNRDFLAAHGVDPQLPQEVDTYGLYVQHIEKRSVRLPDLSTQSILGEIRRLWADIHHPFTAILARPPAEVPTTVHFIVEFLDFHRMPIPGTTPVLRRIFDAEIGEPQIKSAYHVGGVNPYLLTGQVPLRHRCEPWGQHRCTVRRNEEILLPMSRVALEEGDFLDFMVYEQDPNDSDLDDGTNLLQVEEAEGEAAVQLMQRTASRTPRRETATPTSASSSVSPILAHVFHLSAEHRLISFDRAAPLSFFQQLDDLWKRPAHAPSIALHEVKMPPPDLETSADVTFVYELAPDRNRPSGCRDLQSWRDHARDAHSTCPLVKAHHQSTSHAFTGSSCLPL